ncbi:HAD-IIIC family phosphatase [Stenotrophobium rhamnosiphilum]|uniref:aminoglycoside N(3)-acetyltransferase n=1 Tax=Stenotrophobium rhamnosiphilum TaxID=2029166 RepID=A0A2T5MIH2_9GAMM|nr:HAD-IIIC family phosphatase [Stenotrophobium rhamnosiphilum]PTU32360.1 aminoglycoside 3-N-acetyltransferase [Stenotrophobium rhamnosiphilum]
MRQQILDALRSVLSGTPRVAVIHSSIASLAPPASFECWEFLYGLECLIKEGWTIALPAFTFSFCGGRPYQCQDSPSEVGVLADWLLKANPTAIRTPHPIYSFTVAGPAAQRIGACAASTTFGDDSPFALFESEDAVIVMLGCGWEYCTQFHRYEEMAKVPYRYFKTFSGRADLGDGHGERSVSADMFVRKLEANPINDFMPAIGRLREEGAVRSGVLWRGRVEAVSAFDLARVCTSMVAADPYAFVTNRADVVHALANSSQMLRQPVVRIALLGSSNVHMLETALASDCKKFLLDRNVEIYAVPYGQLRQSLLDTESPLHGFKPQVSFFCDRVEDLAGQPTLDGMSHDMLGQLVDQYAELISAYHQSNGNWIVVHRFAVLGYLAAESDGRMAADLISQLNARLGQRLAGLAQVLWVDIAAEAACSVGPVTDTRLWYLGRFPFSERFASQLAKRWLGLINTILGKSARLIVLDLDNTLWGGVLGEDGFAGVHIGGDYPGNAFLAFQRSLKCLSERGIGLAVCSKNDEDLALKAIDALPAMQIRSENLLAHRINWQPKWIGISQICEELNIGLGSVLFVDDNPVEREGVRRNLPEVKILDLPVDPAMYVQALLTSPWLSAASVTAEDMKRVQSYKKRQALNQHKSSSANLNDFYESLGLKLYFQGLNDGNMARAAQLCQKTNQFNTTTRRHDQSNLCKIVADGGDVVVLGSEDRFNEFENIGLLILQRDSEHDKCGFVDSYLLSCRVLGRGLETAVLQWAIARSAKRGWETLKGLIIETERNTPVRSVFLDAGFERGQIEGEWISAANGSANFPSWLTVVDRFTEQSAGPT